MESTIEKALAYEIKKEIAERYFGFRKLIEDDTLDLKEKIRLHSIILEKRICFDVVRIYMLLQDEKLIQEFIDLTGWEERFYYDPYLTESPTLRARVFTGVRKRGLTKAGRFKNLLLDSYSRLVTYVEQYRESLAVLKESQETIDAEIKLFYKKNDIGNIMGFLRSLDTSDSQSSLQGGIEAGLTDSFEQKMRLEPPEPVEKQLPVIPPLIAMSNMGRQLKKLVDKAYKRHGAHFLNTLPK